MFDRVSEPMGKTPSSALIMSNHKSIRGPLVAYTSLFFIDRQIDSRSLLSECVAIKPPV